MTERPKFEMAVTAAKPMFIQAMGGDEKVWNREAVFAIQALRGNEILRKANPDSIKNAVVNIALTGATLNPALQQAYLVPRDGQCCLDFSYRGLLKIATDSGGVKSIQSSVVYDFDEFDYEEGTETFIHFKRNLNPPADFVKDPLKAFWEHLVCAFSIVTLHDGNKDYMILPRWRIEKVRNSSKAKSDKAPWGQWPEEMTRKTVIKYHYKTLPQTDRMSNAISILNEHEGLDLEKQGRAKDIEARFTDLGTTADDPPAEEADDAPKLCPSCEKLLVEGDCHNPKCPEALPPEE